MFDFNQGAGSGGNYDRGEYNQDKASSQLNLANLILVDLVYLIKNGATLETRLKYGGVQPSVFTPFFTAFREIFDLTSHLVDKEVSEEIEEWFEKVDVKSTKSLNDDIVKGLKLARKLKMEIVELGMLKIFEPPIQPPFMLDVVIQKAEKDHEEELAKKSKKTIKEHSKPDQTGIVEPIHTIKSIEMPGSLVTKYPVISMPLPATPDKPQSQPHQPQHGTKIPGVKKRMSRL
jgi:hypothetical protein